MKKFTFLPLLFLLPLLVLSCDGSSSSGSSDKSGGDSRVTLSDEINGIAEEYDNFPSDAQIVATKVGVGDTEIEGEDAADVGNTESSTKDIRVTLPTSLSSRAAFPGISIQLWLNGVYYDVNFDAGLSEVQITLNLTAGKNIFCIVFTKDGKTYRSPVFLIYYYVVDTQLVGKWIKTSAKFETGSKVEGFEFTADGFLYSLKLDLESKGWVQAGVMSENVMTLDGNMTSFDPAHPAATLYVSTYVLSESGGNSVVTISEGATKIYGVKIP